MIKRKLSLFMAIIMILSCTTTVFATNDYTQGTAVVYNGTGAEAYTITVPAALKPGQSGTVTLSGTWADNRTVTVTADKTVTLTNSIKSSDQKVLDVTFAGISEKGSNTGSQTFTETVSVAAISNALFGTWSGKFYYNVEMNNSEHSGIRFGEKYVLTNVMGGNGTPVDWFKFYEDGSVDAFVDGVLQSMPEFVEYQDGKIIVPGGEMIVSPDGTTITESDDTGYSATWTLESSLNTPLKFGEAYVCIKDGYNEGFLGLSFYFYADGSATITDGNYSVTQDAGFYQYSGNKIITTNPDATAELTVSDDGLTITQTENGVVMSLFKINVSDFKYNETYILTYLHPQFSDMISTMPTEMTGYKNGAADVIIGGQEQTLPAGYFVIDGNKIDLGSDNESEQMLILNSGNTISFQLDGEEVARWEITESPIKFGKQYQVIRFSDSTLIGSSITWNRDGSANVYLPDGSLDGALPSGTFAYSGIAIFPMNSSLDMGSFICSEDGNLITAYSEGAIYMQLMISDYSNPDTPLKYGQKYVITECPDIPAMVGVWYVFNIDGSVTTNFVQNKPQTTEPNYFTANATELLFTEQGEAEHHFIAEDGNTITTVIDGATTCVYTLATTLD